MKASGWRGRRLGGIEASLTVTHGALVGTTATTGAAHADGQANQTWTHTSANQLTVTNNGAADCLDADGAGTTQGTKVIIWPCTGAADQQWHLG